MVVPWQQTLSSSWSTAPGGPLIWKLPSHTRSYSQEIAQVCLAILLWKCLPLAVSPLRLKCLLFPSHFLLSSLPVLLPGSPLAPSSSPSVNLTCVYVDFLSSGQLMGILRLYAWLGELLPHRSAVAWLTPCSPCSLALAGHSSICWCSSHTNNPWFGGEQDP